MAKNERISNEVKIAFSKKTIVDAPKEHVRIRFVEDSNVRRLVREDGAEYIELGTGKGKEMTQRKFRVLCRKVVNAAKNAKAAKIAIQFDATPELFSNFAALNISPEDASLIAAQEFTLAAYEFKTFKTQPKKQTVLAEILVCGPVTKSAEAAAQKGQMIAHAMNDCRELANTPGGSLTPKGLAKAAKDAVKGLPVKVTSYERAEIVKMGMGLLAGVGSGSSHTPTFTVMEYRGADSPKAGAKGTSAKPIVLAGKGITFDSGGLNIKPSSGIYEMHMDMSGAAAVIHTVALAAKMKLKRNVIGLIPSAENMPGNEAVRPGDILKSLSGKTVEVTDTDAEGRLVLADAITYAKRFDPAVVIDTATLTGAVMVALGFQHSGLMTRDDKLAQTLLALGESTGDYLWRLPMGDEYEDIIKSDFADMQNHSIGKGRYAGATNGAMFLWQFAKELNCSYAHLDIAPRMTSTSGDELAKGALGASVAVMYSFIEAFEK